MIIIAPYSNDVLRDWPRTHFCSLLAKLSSSPGPDIALVGAPEQRQAINLMIRDLPADRVANRAGLWSWNETVRRISGAQLVIANNSGIAHLGASRGVPTLCLFAASHDPSEWGPRGPKTVTLFCRTACAPCGRSGPGGCRFGQVCMTDLTPEIVFQTVMAMLERKAWSGQDLIDVTRPSVLIP